MKQKWITFFLAALLVVTLAGCGEKNSEPGKKTTDTDTKYATGDDSAANKNGKTDSSAQGETGEKTKIDNTVSGTQTPSVNAKGYVSGEIHPRSWQQMVDNGTVHDCDGDLLDGENSRW